MSLHLVSDTSHSCWACHLWALLSAQRRCVRAGRFSDFWDEIKAYHGMQQTSDIAVSTGWKSVDEFYRVIHHDCLLAPPYLKR